MADITYAVYIDWDNDGSVLAGSPTTGENVTTRVLNVRTGQAFTFGRDTARSLSAVKPAQVAIELNNVSKDYSPDNSSSPLYGDLGTGKPVLIVATHSATSYELFYGYIDDYSIDPFRERKSVMLSCIDSLGKVASAVVQTECYPSIQTGAAINAVLDAAGWDASLRDIDAGATTLRYWVADQTDAWTAIQDIVSSEGIPAIAYVDPETGNFVFRDRHHRLLRAASLTSQATFRDTGSEPLFSDPVEYNVGFRDLINTCVFRVQEREPIAFARVWQTDSTFVVSAGETMTIYCTAQERFIDAVAPVVNTDYKLLAGDATVSISQTSGITTQVSITATTTAYIQGMAIRAYSCPVAREYVVTSLHANSIDKYGVASPDSSSIPDLAGVNDAKAIGDIIVAQRGERLPVISITVKGANDTRKTQILSRKLSDMVTIVEAETSTNHTHFIEKIGHSITLAGKLHTATFGCERVPSASSQFTFGVAGKGFDQGTFGLSGYDDPDTVFILDSAVSGHRLGTGKLAS